MKINIKRVGIAVQLIVALAVSTFSVSAADKLSLSLQQAMDMAVERNNTLANAALDVKIAKANKWAAIAQMLPQISASGDYSNFMGYEMDLRGMTIAMPPYVTLGVRSSLTFTPALLVNTQISEISHKMSDISLQQSEQDI
ncbi:MAG: TolC family protein, partial [Bacteroidales bacterium]|nr:TolC family protein [Bacteroidales bacterium]